jgi:Diacylglycerol kinase
MDISKRLKAAQYSMQGLARLWSEEAFRTEAYAFIASLTVFLMVAARGVDYLIFTSLMLLLFCVEAINTAIEELVDHVSPEISQVGKNAKDLGSFAVFCVISINALFVIYVIARQLML